MFWTRTRQGSKFSLWIFEIWRHLFISESFKFSSSCLCKKVSFQLKLVLQLSSIIVFHFKLLLRLPTLFFIASQDTACFQNSTNGLIFHTELIFAFAKLILCYRFFSRTRENMRDATRERLLCSRRRAPICCRENIESLPQGRRKRET